MLATAVSAQQGKPRALASRARPVTRPAASPAARASGPAGSTAQLWNEKAARPATREIQGRVTDPEGRPVREGKVMFAPQTPLVPFTEAGIAAIDADGRYRIELRVYPHGSEALPATGPLRYLVLAAGFGAEVGTLGARGRAHHSGHSPSAKEWTTTEIRLVDRDAKAVPGAVLTLQMGGPFTWSEEISDAEGRCKVKSAPGQGFSISIKRDGYLTTRFGSRGTADDPRASPFPSTLRSRGALWIRPEIPYRGSRSAG